MSHKYDSDILFLLIIYATLTFTSLVAVAPSLLSMQGYSLYVLYC